MFTTRSTGRPFVGRVLVHARGGTIQSDVAEVAWFVRGRTLYRRLLLVSPGVNLTFRQPVFTPATTYRFAQSGAGAAFRDASPIPW